MKKKLRAALETICTHCKSNHYRCSLCDINENGGCGCAKEPHKWKVKVERHEGQDGEKNC